MPRHFDRLETGLDDPGGLKRGVGPQERGRGEGSQSPPAPAMISVSERGRLLPRTALRKTLEKKGKRTIEHIENESHKILEIKVKIPVLNVRVYVKAHSLTSYKGNLSFYI